MAGERQTYPWQHRATCGCEWCSAERQTPTDAASEFIRSAEAAVAMMDVGSEPAFAPPRIDCCESAIATGGAYHRPGCPDV